MPEFSRCSVQLDTHSFCDREPLPGAPFAICHRHAGEAYAFVADLIADHGPRVRDEIAEAVSANRAELRARPAVVYYLEVGDVIKIGTTQDLVRRLRKYPPTTRLLASEPGGLELEAARLAQFRHGLVSGREWFVPVADLMEHIRQVRSAGYAHAVAEVTTETLPVALPHGVEDTLVSTTEAAHLAGVGVAAISNWKDRGHLIPLALDRRGRPLYRWIDVARAERHTRDRARRTFAA